MEFQKLDKNIIVCWRISRLLLFVVITGLLLLGNHMFQGSEVYASLRNQYPDFQQWDFCVVSGIMLYFFAGIFVYPGIEYRQWQYQITDDKVVIRHGIFYIKTTTIPIARIQHVTLVQGPIYRRLQLAKVTIALASGQHEIEGVNEEVAQQISENLKDRLYRRLNA